MKRRSLITMGVGLAAALIVAGMILKFMDRTPDADQVPAQADVIIEEEIIEIPSQQSDMNTMDMDTQSLGMMMQDEAASVPSMPVSSVVVISTTEDVDMMAQDQGPAVIKFYAPWCGACQYMDKYYSDLPAEFNGAVTFYSVDVGSKKAMDRVEALGLTSKPVEYLPTLVFRMNGAVIEQITGAKDKAEFIAAVRQAFGL